MSTYSAVDVIRTKRDGGRLSDDQIDWFIAAYTDGAVAEEQASALLMAIFWRGMSARRAGPLDPGDDRLGRAARPVRPSPDRPWTSTRPVAWATRSRCRWPRWSRPAGWPCRSCPAAASGHTGGTLDKMESIPGWRAALSNDGVARPAAHGRAR